MRRTCVALSPKLQSNTHPKNAVRWKPGSPGFWRPKYGASMMKWHFMLPYRREVPGSLYHYPEISRISGKPVDWYHGEPTDGYEGSRIYGEHTLELSGMPMGRTPEYMQERLRRFFSKFGPVTHCRAEPHGLDPYQCEGTAYVSFRDRNTALKALKAPLKFPASLHDKVVYMRHLDTDRRNDPDYYEKSKFWNNELISIARQLHMQISGDAELRAVGKPIASVGSGIFEREIITPTERQHPFDAAAASERLLPGRAGVLPSKGGLLASSPTRVVSAVVSVPQRFGSWESFLSEPPFDELFRLERRGPSVEDNESDVAPAGLLVVTPRLVSTRQRARILGRARLALGRRLHDEFSVWWRQGKVPLPEYTQERIRWWDHKPPLPFEYQIMSRSKDVVRIYDERFLYKHQLMMTRNKKRAENRAAWAETRKQILADKKRAVDERREKALAAVNRDRATGLLGISRGLVGPGRRGGGVVAEADRAP